MQKSRQLVGMGVFIAGLTLAGSMALPQTVNLDVERLQQAEFDFHTYCAPCHGRGGLGDGPVALELTKKPSDLTQLAKKAGGEFPTEAVRAMVDGREMPKSHGSREMPVWGNWFSLIATAAGLLQEDQVGAEKEVAERIGRLVEYLKTIQK